MHKSWIKGTLFQLKFIHKNVRGVYIKGICTVTVNFPVVSDIEKAMLRRSSLPTRYRAHWIKGWSNVSVQLEDRRRANMYYYGPGPIGGDIRCRWPLAATMISFCNWIEYTTTCVDLMKSSIIIQLDRHSSKLWRSSNSTFSLRIGRCKQTDTLPPSQGIRRVTTSIF